MIVVYNEDVHWAADFCRGRRSLEVEPWSESLSEAVCTENCLAVENIVFKDLRVNVQLIGDIWSFAYPGIKHSDFFAVSKA